MNPDGQNARIEFLEARVAQTFLRRAHTGEPLPDLDLFGEHVQRSARPSNAGRPRVPLRVMIAPLYLKHAFNLSHAALVERWADSPNFPYFSGQAHVEPRPPCDATTLVKFRRLLGEERCEAHARQFKRLRKILKRQSGYPVE